MAGARGSTVLFVHGAHLAGWCWLLVMDELARAGIDSVAIDLPFTGYEDDVDAVRSAIASARTRGSVQVVCHSYAGLPVAAAAHDAASLVFVAGRLPLPGESPSGVTPQWRFAELTECMELGEDGMVRLSPEADAYFFNRTSAPLTELAMSRMRPMRSLVPDEPLDDPAWTSVPTSYVVCTDDRALPPDGQRDRAALVESFIELDADHSPFFSAPVPLARFIADQHERLAA